MLQAFLDRLTHSGTNTNPPFVRLDNSETYLDHTTIVAAATNEAMNERPETESPLPGENERLIVHQGWADIYSKKAEYDAPIQQLESQLRSLTDQVESAESELTECKEVARLNIGENQAERSAAKAEAAAEIAQCQREVNKCREENGIVRPAVYAADPAWSYARTTGLVVVEAIGSGHIFARTDELALVGGLTTGLTLAGLNCFGSMACGALIRLLDWRTVYSRWALYIFGVVLVLFHIGVGFFRATQVEPSETVFFTLGAFSFDFYTLVLILLGLAFGAWSAREGYALEDPIPGYSASVRQLHAAQEKEKRIKGAEFHALPALRKQALESVDDVVEGIEQTRQTYIVVATKLQALREQLRNDIDQLVSRCIGAVELLRSTNMHIRTTPAPPCMQDDPKAAFDTSELFLGYPLTDPNEMAHEITTRVSALRTQAQTVKSEIQEMFTHARMQVGSPSDVQDEPQPRKRRKKKHEAKPESNADQPSLMPTEAEEKEYVNGYTETSTTEKHFNGKGPAEDAAHQ